ncbi:MAG: C45 family peptidase [Synergistaceae bacterium]|jgi:hypothetical protein|nr:C45 family peptidase [Synergistaceae bacterium]
MCTLGSVNRKYLFKNRDIGTENSFEEEIVRNKRRYSYVGVAGRTNRQERGLNSGINEWGVSAAITWVGGPEGLSEDILRKTPRGVIVEDVVGNAKNLLEAAEIAQWHLVRGAHVGGNIVIANEEGIVSIEEIDRRFAVEFVEEDFFFRTNHFLNLTRPVENDDSPHRFEAIRRLFSEKSAEDVDVPFIREQLAWRGEDAFIYKKTEDGLGSATVSAVIYDIPSCVAHYRYVCDPGASWQILEPPQ